MTKRKIDLALVTIFICSIAYFVYSSTNNSKKINLGSYPLTKILLLNDTIVNLGNISFNDTSIFKIEFVNNGGNNL
jgi:hypothetical protein